MAALLVRNSIRLTPFSQDEYPAMGTAENLSEPQPPTPDILQRLVKGIISPSSAGGAVGKRRCSTIVQAIMSACRPRSYTSPLLLALGVFIHKNFGSRELLEMLSSLGVSATYKEVTRYVNSQLRDKSTTLPDSIEGIVQFVFDNADVNVATQTGELLL